MGRAPCCDKANVKKGPWSPEEDAKLKAYIEHHGTGGNWIALPPKIGLKRCGKSCRLRWLNYLRPNIKHGGFSEEEDKIICSLYISIGSRWSIIAAQLPGRTDNDIKNYWNTRLKKKLLGKQRKEQQQSRRSGGNESNMVVADNNNQIRPYWPELPVLAAHIPIPYSNSSSSQEQGINIDSQASMRRLLVKLGGRFSDDHAHDHDHVVNIDGLSTLDQFPNDSSSQLDQQLHMPSSSSSSPPPPMVNSISQYSTIDTAYLHMLQGQGSFSSEMAYGANPQRLDGMEFLLYGEDTSRALNNSCESISMGWGTEAAASELYGGIIQEGMLQQYANSSHELMMRCPPGSAQQ